MENMDIDIVETSKQSDSPEEQELNNHDQDTDSDILDSDNGSDNNSRLSSPLSTSTAKLVKSPPPSVVPPTISHRHSIPLNIDFANLSALSNGTSAASNAFNGGISSDPASELFFNYQLARNAASFSPFAFPNSPIFLPPSLLKPTNYIQQGNNPLRPLNLSLGTVSNPSDIVSAAAAAAAISLANSHSSNGLSTNSLGHQSSSKLSQSIMVSSSNQSNNCPNSSKLQQQQQTNSSKRLSPNLLCVVCGDLSSGKHYGILACNGCSGFFKRSVRRKLIYRCQAGTGSCIIDKQHRNQCQACRLKKCISMGMNKDAVQNERQPRNTATIRPEVLMSDCNSERLLREGVAATVAAVFGLSSSLRRDNSLKQFTSYSHHHGHGNSDNSATTKATSFKEATSPNGKKFDLKAHTNNGRECNDSASALFNPNLCYSNSLSLDYSQLSDISNSLLLLNQDSFYEISARILFMGVKWIKNLPSFVNLSFRDQTILMEESWTEIFILSAIQWSLPLEKCSIFSAANIPNGTDYSLDIRVLNDTFERFRQIAPNAGEFACLKALALFKPEARGLKEVSKIEQMQDQTQLMLLQQVKNQNSSNPIRYGKLLLLLLSLKIIPSDKIATIYFKKAIGNTTIEKLLREMFKC